jgi:hypothetical protein
MSESNIYFVPVEYSMLSEYLSSGFIGLTASKEPDSDIQSLGFPNVSIVNDLSDVAHEVCLEIEVPQTATKSSKKSYSYLKGPVSIARINNIIFFDRVTQQNFMNSFSMLNDLPIELFNLTTRERPNLNKASILSLSESKSANNTHLYINELTTLNIGIVEAFCHLSEEFEIDLNIKIPKSQISPEDIYKKIVSSLLKEIKLFKKTPQFSFDLLELYLNAVSAGHTTPDNSSVSSEEVLHSMKEQISPPDEESAANVYLNKFIDKTNLIMIGMTKAELMDDQPNLALQRAIFLAITRKSIKSLDNIDRNLKLGVVVGALAKLLIIFRSKISDLPKELWRKDRKQFDNYLLTSEQIAQQNKYVLNTQLISRNTKFSSNTIISINDIEVCSREVEASAEVLTLVQRLRSLRFKPTPAPDGSISIKLKIEGGPTIPIKLEVKDCPITSLKRNIVISTHVSGLTNVLDKKKTRLEFLQLMHNHMVSVGLIDKKVIEISRYQLADTLDRDELLHHIELIRSAYLKLTSIYSIS